MPSRGNRHISSSRSRTKRFVDRVDFDLYCCLCRRHRLIVVRFVTRVSQQAKLWVQVIRQLRNGVKLKASGVGESARKPIEYELTPYEMMMDDIRSRRYKLRQVMVDGVIPPRVKKDAHAVILEFIRSRPPLRKVFITFSFSFSLFVFASCAAPRIRHCNWSLVNFILFFQASERKLRPLARRISTPVELLMESIRQHDSKELRPTRCLMVDRTGESRREEVHQPIEFTCVAMTKREKGWKKEQGRFQIAQPSRLRPSGNHNGHRSKNPALAALHYSCRKGDSVVICLWRHCSCSRHIIARSSSSSHSIAQRGEEEDEGV